jgi:hypothetical protein
MTIPAAAKPTPIPQFDISSPLIEKSGNLSTRGLQRVERLRGYVSGMGRIIPCSCSSSSNVYTLTPNGNGEEDGEAPLIEGYVFGDIYLFVADASSTGSVTATVVPKTGTLDTLKVYINGGGSQAGNTDITSGHVYLGVYAYNLDSGAGGIVIRHP